MVFDQKQVTLQYNLSLYNKSYLGKRDIASYYAEITSHQQLHSPSHMNRTLSLLRFHDLVSAQPKNSKTLQYTISKPKIYIVTGANGPLG